MTSIDRIAHDFMLENNISKIHLTVKDLKERCEENLDLSIIPYSAAHELMERYGLHDYLNLASFNYRIDDAAIIFYDDSISQSKQTIAVLHEIGHIILKHTYITDGVQEDEANEFVRHVLAPICVLDACGAKGATDVKNITMLRDQNYVDRVLIDLANYHKFKDDKLLIRRFRSFINTYQMPRKKAIRFSIYAVLAALAIAVSVWLVAWLISGPLGGSDAVTAYRTMHGEVYHISLDCPYIKNKLYIIEMTSDTAKAVGFPLCSTCEEMRRIGHDFKDP